MIDLRTDSVQSILDQHLAPLQRRVRASAIADLAEELSGREPEQDGGPERLVAQVLRMKQITEHKLGELDALQKRWDDFTKRYLKAQDPRTQRRAMSDYITLTVKDPLKRRADLAALDRALDYDALRERHLFERADLLAMIELAVTFIANAGTAALEGAVQRGRERIVREMFQAARVDFFLKTVVEVSPRWQIRRVALEGLIGLAVAARRHTQDRDLSAHLRSQHLGLAVRCATNIDEHPWVQGSGIRFAFTLSEDLAIDLATKRLLEPQPGKRDFLVRRQCVEMLARRDDRMRDVLRRVLVHKDPSEHVRQGLAYAFARMGGFVELRVLAGLDPASPEMSPRVRAAAVEGACKHAKGDVGHALELVIDVLARDTDPLPIAVACEEIDALVTDPSASPEAIDRALETLLAIAGHPARLFAIHEATAAAAERVSRVHSYERRVWRDYIAGRIATLRPGRSMSIQLLSSLPRLPADPMFLGRILAELSREDFPLFASRRGEKLVVWRGDKMRRRLWRILHEIKSPRPNKRQGHHHTVGRVMRGYLRAPPGGLDEVTATVVPGERVLVPEEAGWGRHLPSVDDLLDLPLHSSDPVHVFSSHGTTTIRPAGSLFARLRNRLAISFRYEALAALRLAALSGLEPHVRVRYVEVLREHYGIDITFARYEYAGKNAPTPERLQRLFTLPALEGAAA